MDLSKTLSLSVDKLVKQNSANLHSPTTPELRLAKQSKSAPCGVKPPRILVRPEHLFQNVQAGETSCVQRGTSTISQIDTENVQKSSKITENHIPAARSGCSCSNRHRAGGAGRGQGRRVGRDRREIPGLRPRNILEGNAAVHCLWWFDQLGWSWECLPDSSGKQNRLVLVIHILMHHRAVAVALYIRYEALIRVAPTRLANLFACHAPHVETLEMLPPNFCIVLGHKIHKRVTEPHRCLEVAWQIDKVIATVEPFGIEQIQ